MLSSLVSSHLSDFILSKRW